MKTLLAILILFLCILACSNKNETTSIKDTTTSELPAPEIKGTLSNYHDYTGIEKDGKYVFLFFPALPRNDETVVSSIKELIYKLYDTKPKGKPVLEQRNETNLIKLSDSDSNFLSLLYKNDNGTVYSLVLWKE